MSRTAASLANPETDAVRSDALSRRIAVARLLLILGLVFLHYMRFPEAEQTLFEAFDRAEVPPAAFIGTMVLYFFFAAVPLLSLISGYLFLQGVARGSMGRAFRNRVRTLLLPFLLWNGMALAGIGAVYAMFPDPRLLGMVSFDYAGADAWAWLDAWLGIDRPPALFQFWFVRDLIVTVALSPLLLLAVRQVPLIGGLVLGAAWLAGHDLWIFRRTDVVFFFYLGLWLARSADRPIPVPDWRPWLSAYLGLVLLRTGAPAFIDELSPTVEPWLDMATRSMRIVGVVACWAVIAAIARTAAGARIAAWSGLAFFVFALHHPTIMVVKTALAAVMPLDGSGWLVLHYLLSSSLTAALCLLIGRGLAQVAPGLLSILNGGRLVGPPPARPGEREATA